MTAAAQAGTESTSCVTITLATNYGVNFCFVFQVYFWKLLKDSSELSCKHRSGEFKKHLMCHFPQAALSALYKFSFVLSSSCVLFNSVSALKSKTLITNKPLCGWKKIAVLSKRTPSWFQFHSFIVGWLCAWVKMYLAPSVVSLCYFALKFWNCMHVL